ncbi:MAG: hydrolase [Janthinobacterium lividum]
MSGLSSREQALVAAIDPAPLLDRTTRWASINSGTGNLAGLAAMAGELADACSTLPGAVSLVGAVPVERIGTDGHPLQIAHGDHLLVRVRPEATRRVLLTGHMDTVYAADDPFQRCTRDGDVLHGPGTADMKGGLAIMLAGVAAFEAGGPSLGYDILVNSDEETGSPSSAALIAEVASGKIAALTYEPALAGGRMARARPGSGNFSAVVRGRSAHAGRDPGEGRNALVAAADLAVRLAALVGPGLSVNPARIDGGGPNNRVPDLAILRFNVRPRSPEDEGLAAERIASAIAHIARAHEVAVALHGGFARPPKPITPATERLFALIATASGDLGLPLDWVDTGGVCDGNNIAAAGVPVIDTMGATGGAIHSPDEWLSVASLGARAHLTALTLHRIDRGAMA